jgi:uncharacterized integral membrane protein
MAAFLKWIVLAPIAILVILLAIANRHDVTVVFDPFAASPQAGAALTVTLPLFLALFAAAMLGVVIGGVSVWFGQARHRRAARANQSDASRARAESDRLRAQMAALPALPNDRRAA